MKRVVSGLRWMISVFRLRARKWIKTLQSSVPPTHAVDQPASGLWQILDASGQRLGPALLEGLSAAGVCAREVGWLPNRPDDDQRVILLLPFAVGNASMTFELSAAGQAVEQLTAWARTGNLIDVQRPRLILVWAIESDSRCTVALARDPETRRVHANSWFLTGHWWRQRLAYWQYDEQRCLTEYAQRSATLLRLAPFGPTLRNRFIDLAVWIEELRPTYLVISQSIGNPDRWHGLAAVVAAVRQENRGLPPAVAGTCAGDTTTSPSSTTTGTWTWPSSTGTLRWSRPPT